MVIQPYGIFRCAYVYVSLVWRAEAEAEERAAEAREMVDLVGDVRLTLG